jgi:glyoxylate reductase
VKYICHSGAGYDNIDVEACTARGHFPDQDIERGRDADERIGIAVSNTPNINKYAVADLSIFLMIGALRRLQGPLTAIRLGQSITHPKIFHVSS